MSVKGKTEPEIIPPEIEAKIATTPPDLQEVWRNIYRNAKSDEAEQEQAAPVPAKKTNVVQLDFWENGKRGGPNAIFRAALFPALSRQTRRFLKEEHLFSVRGVEVVFTGEQFDQSDLDVYLEILNFAKPFPLGTPVRFSAYAMLKALGKSTGGKDLKWLHSTLIRLRGGTVDMTDHKKRYFGGLIEGAIKDELMEHYEVDLNPKFAVLFGFGMWSKIDLAQRQALRRNPTAKALHAYYSTHTAPHGHDIKTLADIAGLKNSNPRDLKANIIKAHDLLASPEVRFLSGYELVGDVIKVKINHSKSQLGHLAKKGTDKLRKGRKKGDQ